MTLRRHLTLLLFLSLIPAGLHADEIDDAVKEAIAEHHIPGVSLVIVKDGAVIKSAGYGLAKIEHNIAARPDTVFKIGSVSKQFLASGIMLLVQDGKIGLADPVSKYLPDVPEAWKAVTIRHLLTHTGGLPREAPGFDPWKRQPDIDVIRTAYSMPVRFAAGEKWEYSNVGYFALAQIIANVSGKSYDEFLRQRVFRPLGMNATQVTSVEAIMPHRAAGYIWKSNELRNEGDWPALRPSGAFVSTAPDLAKWEAALLAGDILKRETLAEMWTPVTLNDGKTYPYGFGWYLNEWPGKSKKPTGIKMIRHSGSLPGFRATYFRWPSTGLAIILLSNESAAQVETIAMDLARLCSPELREAGK